ncbi:unnamed protein product [marine sediment metagenome]|uniref:Uncharacterized protein n=1 Tax=marine sediment metagenome TaxID=412755 RepID=X1MTB8_9ZZZZ
MIYQCLKQKDMVRQQSRSSGLINKNIEYAGLLQMPQNSFFQQPPQILYLGGLPFSDKKQ